MSPVRKALIFLGIFIIVLWSVTIFLITSNGDRIFSLHQNKPPQQHLTATWRCEIEEPNAGGKLSYFIFSPFYDFTSPSPILVVIEGMHNPGQKIISNDLWRKFCLDNGCALVVPEFHHDEEQWKNSQSFQYPQIWSGEALNRIFTKEAQRANLDKSRVFIFGFSAGAQFATRYALYAPKRTIAVAAHAAGSYTNPKEKIPTSFLISVGLQDTNRIDGARQFVQSCQNFHIDAELVEVPNLGHGLNHSVLSQATKFLADQMK